MKKLCKWTLAGLMVMGLLGGQADAAEPIKIGAVNPYSGVMGIYGVELTRGFELAVDQVNAAGGVLGRPIELVRGDASNPQQAIAAVEQLVNKDKVDLLIGSYTSGISNAASDKALQLNRFYLETTALAPELTMRGLPNYVRTGPDGLNFTVGATQTIKNLIAPSLKKDVKDLKVWIEHESGIYGTALSQSLKRLLEAEKIQVVGMGAHAASTVDVTDTILRASRTMPDVFVQIGYVPDGNLLLRTAREQGFKPGAMLWVGVGDTPETLNAMGAASIEGLLVVCYPRTDINENFGPGAKNYLAAYRAKYKSDPIAPQSMNGFAGMLMLVEAMKIAGGTDSDKIHQAFSKLDKPMGSYVTGYGAKFDSNFQNQAAFPVTAQWQSGKLVTVYPARAIAPGSELKKLTGAN
jgi:branched-chain amino acid transport system substrate-binding protein